MPKLNRKTHTNCGQMVVGTIVHATGFLTSYWLGKTKILKHTQFLCQFYELRKLNKRIGVEGCGFVMWFGKYTEIAFLVSLFGYTQPIARPVRYLKVECGLQ